VKRLIFGLALAMGVLTAAQGACVAATADNSRAATPDSNHATVTPHGTTSKLTVDTKQDLLNPPLDKPASKYKVTLWVNVPHYKGCIESFKAVPYLSEIPVPLHTYGSLSERYGDIKDSLYILCYVAPQNPKLHKYSGQGWRFSYCLDQAKRESGLGMPHVLPEARAWCEAMYPYVHKYLVRSNEAEALRADRLRKARADYDETHSEIEYAALKKGYFPVDLNFIVYHESLRRAVIDLPEGTWWITGTHKVIGITYYWQEPIEVGPDKPNTMQLTEQSALLIDSAAW